MENEAIKHKRRKYDQNAMEKAVNAMKNNECTSYREACRTYGVPYTTLYDKVNGNTPMECALGPAPMLDRLVKEARIGVSIEKLVYEHLIKQSRRGFPLKRENLSQLVIQILETEKLSNPFVNGTPGRSWRKLFFKRFPDLREKEAEHHSIAKAKLTEGAIRGWHKKVATFFADEGLESVMSNPCRVFNCDETPFNICEKTGKFIGRSGESLQYVDTSGSDKENYTVMVTACADGSVVIPLLVLKYQRIPQKVLQSRPKGWEYIRTDSGWITGKAMLEFGKIFVDHLVSKGLLDKDGDGQKVVLFMDGYSAHLDVDFSLFCEEHGVVVICFIANSTHLLQPVDVGINAPLKKYWCRAVQNHKLTTAGRITKYNVGEKLAEAFSCITPETVTNAFRRCGVFPFDASAIDYSKLISFQIENEDGVNKSPRNCSDEGQLLALKALEGCIPRDIITQMESTYSIGLEWGGHEGYKTLFEAWRKLKGAALAEAGQLSVSAGVGTTDEHQNMPEIIPDHPLECYDHDNELLLPETSPSSSPSSLDDFTQMSSGHQSNVYDHQSWTPALKDSILTNKGVEHAEQEVLPPNSSLFSLIEASDILMNEEYCHEISDSGYAESQTLDVVTSTPNIYKSSGVQIGALSGFDDVSEQYSTPLDLTKSSSTHCESLSGFSSEPCLQERHLNSASNAYADLTKTDLSCTSTELGSLSSSPQSQQRQPFAELLEQQDYRRPLNSNTLALLNPSSLPSNSRVYKARENVYFLSTSQHRDLVAGKKAAAAAEKEKKKIQKIKTNVLNHTDFEVICKHCLYSQQKDIENPKKRKITWLLCKNCKSWVHEKCCPRKVKAPYPSLIKRIAAGDVFDFSCC